MKKTLFLVLAIIFGFLAHEYWVLPSVPTHQTSISTISLATILGLAIWAAMLFFSHRPK